MRLPRDLNGRELARVLCRDWDYHVINREGSHNHPANQFAVPQRISVPDPSSFTR